MTRCSGVPYLCYEKMITQVRIVIPFFHFPYDSMTKYETDFPPTTYHYDNITYSSQQIIPFVIFFGIDALMTTLTCKNIDISQISIFSFDIYRHSILIKKYLLILNIDISKNFDIPIYYSFDSASLSQELVARPQFAARPLVALNISMLFSDWILGKTLLFENLMTVCDM